MSDKIPCENCILLPKCIDKYKQISKEIFDDLDRGGLYIGRYELLYRTLLRMNCSIINNNYKDISIGKMATLSKLFNGNDI